MSLFTINIYPSINEEKLDQIITKVNHIGELMNAQQQKIDEAVARLEKARQEIVNQNTALKAQIEELKELGTVDTTALEAIAEALDALNPDDPTDPVDPVV